MWGLDATRSRRGASRAEGRAAEGDHPACRARSDRKSGRPRRGQSPCPEGVRCVVGFAVFEVLGGIMRKERPMPAMPPARSPVSRDLAATTRCRQPDQVWAARPGGMGFGQELQRGRGAPRQRLTGLSWPARRRDRRLLQPGRQQSRFPHVHVQGPLPLMAESNSRSLRLADSRMSMSRDRCSIPRDCCRRR